MPDKAHKIRKGGPEVEARNCGIEQKGDIFYCITPSCGALMTLVRAGDPDHAHFRRKPSSPKHISTKCSTCSLIFYDSDYDEGKFNRDKAFDWMLSITKREPRGTTGSKTGSVGGGKPPVKTLGVLYSLCKNRKKTETYNGILINDLIADEENYTRYGSGINGRLIVECSYFKKAHGEYAFILNYPLDFRKIHGGVKIIFEVESLFWKYYNTLKNSHHTEPIVVAGNWQPVIGHAEYQSECVIVSSRQIHYIK
ncbi:MAG: hypothetical protein LBT06_08630 [Hungatella sp.]|nr:hypothetical protein [Hungatella sp.]